jgi:outer membrane protein OmpA-like peptidoglycan-associated protein
MNRSISIYLNQIVVKVFLLIFFTLGLAQGQDRKKLPEPINTPNTIEYAPSITADGQTMIYQSDQYGLFVNANRKVPQINADGKNNQMLDEFETSFFGVYEVKLHPSGQWMEPKPIEVINRYASEFMTPVMGGPSVSYDGNTIFFFANFGKNGYGREDIYVSERQKNGWSKPENIGSAINTDNYEGFPSISPDGKKLFFTREILGKKVDEKQCYKIMVSEKGRNGKWRVPYELPSPINMDCEKAPRILADGKTLVFSSIKKSGKGDFDLYKSMLQEDGKWSDPIMLEFVNTKKSDLFVSVSPCGDMMYYVSNGDIFTTTLPESLRPVKSATIQGYVIDSISKMPISQRVVVKSKTSESTLAVIDNNASDGRYTVIVPFGDSYELSVNHPDYFTKTITLQNQDIKDCLPISLNFPLKKLPSNEAEQVQVAQLETPQKEVTKKITEVANKEQSLADASKVSSKPEEGKSQPKQIEELELIADSPTANAQKITAQGEKQEGVKTITNYALMLKIVNKETGEIVRNPQFELTKNNTEAFDEKPSFNGQEYIFKIVEKQSFKVSVNAEGFLPFSAQIPELTTDRKVTIKLAPRLKNNLIVYVKDKETDQKLAAEISLKTNDGTEKVKIENGLFKKELTKSGVILITASAEGYQNLEKSVEVGLIENEGKTIEVELQLVTSEFAINLQANDLETGQPIPGAVFYVEDENKKRVLELLADDKGNAEGKLKTNGKYFVTFLAPGFNKSEQVISDLLRQTNVLFKSVKEKVSTHELKVSIFDRYTNEELLPMAVVDQQSEQKAPFFVKGKENQVFQIGLKGNGIKPEKYAIAFNDSLVNKVSTKLLAEKISYDFFFTFFEKNSQEPVRKVSFKVIDIATKEEVQVNKNGEYQAALQPGKNYAFQVNTPGFEELSRKIVALDWIKENDFERNIGLVKTAVASAPPAQAPKSVIKSEVFGEIVKGKKITLENIYFDQSSPVLRKESFGQLDELVKILKDNPTITIEIRGHTDNVGDFYENVKLSKARCESVMEYLTTKSVEKSRLSTAGKGPVEPLVPNDSEENKKKNRRVEFVVL